MKVIEPKIAIILVNYNGVNDTFECIESLSTSTYNNFKIIVVDNKSTDNSAQILRKYQSKYNYILLEAKNNDGFSSGNNIGIRYAVEHKFDYVLLLNNDTLVDKHFLKELILTQNYYEDKAIISSKIYYAYDRNRIWYAGGTFNKITSRTEHIGIHEIDCGQFNEEKKVSFISGCCMFIPIEAILKVGYMEDLYFLYCEDTDYGCRFLEKGYDLIYQPKAILYHKVNSSTNKISNSICYYMVRNKLYIIKKFIKPKYHYIAYLYVFLENIKRIITREYSLIIVWNATIDFFNNKIGMSFNG